MHAAKSLVLGVSKLQVFNYYDLAFFSLQSKSAHFSKVFHLTVQLEVVTVWQRTVYGTTTLIQRVADVTLTSTAGTFLLVQLLGRTVHFGAGLSLVRTLTLRSEVLLYREVNTMLVRLNAENLFRKLTERPVFSPLLFKTSTCMAMIFCRALRPRQKLIFE